MAVTLNPCVRTILCALARPVLAALASIIDAQLVLISTEVAAIQAQLVVVNIAVAPVQVLAGLVESEIQAVQSVGNLVPVQLMLNCADLGDVMVSLNKALAFTTAEAVAIEAKLKRLLSFKFSLSAALKFFQGLQDQLNALKAEINQALSPGGCP